MPELTPRPEPFSLKNAELSPRPELFSLTNA
jgi:hypothetical protein